MNLVLPPGGTRGTELPRLLRPIVRAMMGTGGLMFRLGVRVQGRPLLRLSTVGARSGTRRETVLGWFPSQPDRTDSWIVVASNAGSARHPAWAHNLAKNPDKARADLGQGEMGVDVELLAGDEREAVWNQVVDMAPGYESYRQKTDRQIPIFRLTPRP